MYISFGARLFSHQHFLEMEAKYSLPRGSIIGVLLNLFNSNCEDDKTIGSAFLKASIGGEMFAALVELGNVKLIDDKNCKINFPPSFSYHCDL